MERMMTNATTMVDKLETRVGEGHGGGSINLEGIHTECLEPTGDLSAVKLLIPCLIPCKTAAENRTFGFLLQ